MLDFKFEDSQPNVLVVHKHSSPNPKPFKDMSDKNDNLKDNDDCVSRPLHHPQSPRFGGELDGLGSIDQIKTKIICKEVTLENEAEEASPFAQA